MTKTQAKTFPYIKLEAEKNRFFCVQQRLGMVGWILFFKKTILRPVIRTQPKRFSLKVGKDWVRRQYGLLIRNIRILLHFAIYRKRGWGSGFQLELPCFGHLCVPVHQGHKIFDLRRSVVIKVFEQDVHPSLIVHEIETVQHISHIDFAPTMCKWNLEERWYEEEYLTGSLDSSHNPMDTETLLTKFRDDVVHKLNALILFQDPTIKNAVTYIHDITQKIYSSRLSKQEATVGEFRRIAHFINAILDQLRRIDGDSIFLVFTHGDFAPANMLNTPQGLKIIDWENSGYRSALFDFYCYFFYRSANRAVPIATLRGELQEAFPLFMGELAKTARDVSQSVRQDEHLYRWIFYIEMLCRLVEREVSDKNLEVMSFITQYLKSFTAYEEMLGLHDISLKLSPSPPQFPTAINE